MLVSRLSHRPFASFARVFASKGAMRTTSAHLRSCVRAAHVVEVIALSSSKPRSCGSCSITYFQCTHLDVEDRISDLFPALPRVLQGRTFFSDCNMKLIHDDGCNLSKVMIHGAALTFHSSSSLQTVTFFALSAAARAVIECAS